MILIPSGLPGSGKSTFAHKWLAEDPKNRQRVSYDDLRVILYGCKGPTYFSKGSRAVRAMENVVKQEARVNASLWLKINPEEHSVVVDNCNLTDRARQPWIALAQEVGVPYELIDMSPNVATCVARDKLRKGDERVGRAIIERMALTTGWIDWNDLPPKWNPSKGSPDIVLVDIDGTLSDPSHRLHHIHPPSIRDFDVPLNHIWKPRWDLFGAEVDKDLPNSRIIELVRHLSLHYWIIIVSGRSPEHGCEIKTEDWLDTHLGIPYLHLFMRQGGDYKPDYEHKQEILDLLPHDRIAFTIDDRNQVVQMWRKNGLTCLQVAEGKF